MQETSIIYFWPMSLSQREQSTHLYKLFHDGGLYYIKTSLLNQCTGFYMIGIRRHERVKNREH